MSNVRPLEAMHPQLEMLQGKPVSRVWRGYGSALFLEFGGLMDVRSPAGKRSVKTGELTLMIEWSWRIERPRSILGGSCSAEGRWPAMFKQLQGATVTLVEVCGKLPEIVVSLSNGLRVCSYMTAEGQPQWAILIRGGKLGSLSVKGGRLSVAAPGA